MTYPIPNELISELRDAWINGAPAVRDARSLYEKACAEVAIAKSQVEHPNTPKPQDYIGPYQYCESVNKALSVQRKAENAWLAERENAARLFDEETGFRKA